MTKSAHHTPHASQDDAVHWNWVYESYALEAVSWHEPEPRASLAALALAVIPTKAALVDVGRPPRGWSSICWMAG